MESNSLEGGLSLSSSEIQDRDTAPIVGDQLKVIFQEDDPFQILKEECVERVDAESTRMEITDLCRGCLGVKDVADMQDSNLSSINIIAIYEELTKTKMDTTNVPARMCLSCIVLLTKTDQFIKTLDDSYRVLEKAAQEIQALQNMKILEPDNYNLKKRSILQSALKGNYLVTQVKRVSNSPTEISMEENRLNDFLSDGEVGDSLSVHNDSATSDDEIPLAARFSIDVNKVAVSFQRNNVKESSKDSPNRKRRKKNRKNLDNVPDDAAIDRRKSRDRTLNNCRTDSHDTCLLCSKKVRCFTKHLHSVHLVDWTEAKCLKCSYQNVDRETLVEHCKKCTMKKLIHDKLECIDGDEVKIEWKEETIDADCYPDFKVADEERKDLKYVGYEETEDPEVTKRRNSTKNKKKKNKFDCNKCEEAFKTYEEIEDHFKITHKSESTCILCDQEYTNAFSLLYHMMVKHGKLKCCRLCLVSFRNAEELNRHYKSEEHNTKCTVCGEQFKNRKALYEHRRKKHLNPQLENQKYKCPECPKEFANQNNIRRHILVAHNDLRFLCDTCGQSYTTKRNLKLHIQKFHEGLQVETKNTKKNFFCEACGRELKIFHKYAIAMHRAKHKGHNYVCKKCYETFASEELFKKHVEELGHQLYECHKCQSQFVREENYKIHLKNHDAPGWNKNMFATWGKSAKLRNEKGEFVCSYCPKVFKDKQRLDNHVRVHTNERPYKCHICGKGFKTWIHRKTHLNIHLGIKKWICKYCSKAFTNSCTLKGHEMIHTGERPHRCPECKKGFITMSAMKKHRMVHLRSGGSTYGKKANRILKDEDKTDSENEENSEFVYKYGQMFTGSDVSYESFVEHPKAEPVGMVSIEKELTC